MPRQVFTTVDGVRLTGRHRRSEPGTASTVRAAVVVVHGFSASANCPHVEELADALHADGFDVITYDARGHGTSDGESTLGDNEQHDVAAAVAFARRRTPAVVLVGASMGAIAAVRYAADDPNLAGVVAVSCPAAWRLPRNVRGVLAAAMTRTSVGRRITSRVAGVRVARRWTNPLPPVALVPTLRVPTVFVHGTADRFISPRDAAMLSEATPEPRRLVIVPGMGHAFEPVAIEPIRDAVAWVLDHAALVTR